MEDRYKAAMASASADSGGGESKSESKFDGSDGSRADVEELRSEIAELKRDSSRKINDSVQFKQMKKMLQQKNTKVIDGCNLFKFHLCIRFCSVSLFASHPMPRLLYVPCVDQGDAGEARKI